MEFSFQAWGISGGAQSAQLKQNINVGGHFGDAIKNHPNNGRNQRILYPSF